MPAFDRADALRADLDAMRPLDPSHVGRATQRLRLEWTYHSNAIEGNSLTYGETVALLMHGVTAQGKPLKDHLDIRGHREALGYLERLVQAREPLTLAAVRELHRVLLGEPYDAWAETPEGLRVRRPITPGQFKTQPNHVLTQTGEVHHYARPDEVEPRMQALVDAVEEAWPAIGSGTLHPIAFAASVHHEVASIHPFDDGNGRMARLLMNLVLMRASYVPAVIRQDRRPAYYGALAAADAGDPASFERFVADALAETMELYVRALRGEPDPDAFSHRVALLRREVETKSETLTLTTARRALLAREFVLPLIDGAEERVQQLRPLFGDEGFALFVSGSTEKVSLDKERQLLQAGDWQSFRFFWSLRLFRARPSFTCSVGWEGLAGNSSFVLRSRTEPDETEFTSVLPGPQDASLLLDAAFEQLLNQIEAATRDLDA